MLTTNPLETTGWLMIAFPAAVLIIVLVLKKVLQWLDDRGYIFYTGDPSTYGSLGSAFLELQKIVEPRSQYVLEVKDEEENHLDQDGEAGPDDPTRHLGKPE